MSNPPGKRPSSLMEFAKRSLARALRPIGPPLMRAMAADQRDNDQWMTLHLRPNRTADISTFPDAFAAPFSLGIVLQGPVMTQSDFTLETVRLYRRHNPGATIIVSTWESENPAVLDTLRQAGAEVTLSARPKAAGPFNTNLQLVSAAAGIALARQRGVTFAVKTRTDQRCYAPNAMHFMRAMVEAFPPKPGTRQRGRIVGVSANTYKYRYYGLSDFLTFGYTEDLLDYWGAELDLRPLPPNYVAPMEIGAYGEANLVEVYFVTQYLRLLGRPVLFTLKDSWDAFADHLCVVDAESLDFFWPKYVPWEEYRYRRYQPQASDGMTFRDWFLLYRGYVDRSAAPQEYQKLSWTDPLPIRPAPPAAP